MQRFLLRREIMSVELLDKTRKIGQLLHNNSSSKVVFNDICAVLTDILESNVLVISRKGKVLGVGLSDHIEELNLETLGFTGENLHKFQAIVNPIEIAGERLGTVFMYRIDKPFEIDDIILAEYGTTVVGLEMMRSLNEESAEENRKVQIVKSAINTLSYSELEAIVHIFDELGGPEGVLVASKIADRVGITRSVIVNALRKFESAGVIESKSSGMKGTYIKVLNDAVYDQLKEIKKTKKL